MKEFLRNADRAFIDILQSLVGNDVAFLLIRGLIETLYMVSFSLVFACAFGLPLGVLLVFSRPDSIKPLPKFNATLSWLVNIVRSFPFMVLIIALLPLCGALIGVSTGSSAAIIALSIAAIPFIARLFEGALLEVSKDLIEAMQACGANYWDITKAMIGEAKPALANAITITAISLVGYSAMAGIVGGGGLGDLAYRLGFNSFRDDILVYSVLVIIVLVQALQSGGDLWVKILRKNR